MSSARPPFADRLLEAWTTLGSAVCVGLDPDPARLPEAVRGEPDPVFAFNRAIIDATAPFAVAYKPQMAHYHALGAEDTLARTMAYLAAHHPRHLRVLDGKRNDIGSTAERYAKEAFGRYDADAMTASPYLGGDSLEPLSRDATRGVFVLCRTSNPGARDLQDLDVGGRPLYRAVAALVAGPWNARRNLGIVVGATWPEELATLRGDCPDLPFLVPGVGAQGGDPVQVSRLGRRADGHGLLVNSSRAILHASAGPDFAEAAARAAAELRDALHGAAPPKTGP